MGTGRSQINLGNAIWHQRSSKNDLRRDNDSRRSFRSPALADWYSHVVLAELPRCQELTYFFSTAYFLQFFQTIPWVQTVKWWFDSSKVGGEQQASISERRRGVFTKLPSLHLALSPDEAGSYRCLPIGFGNTNTGHPLPLSLSAPSRKRKQTHTDRLSFAYSVTRPSSRSLFPSEHPASVCETDHWDALCGREPATGLHCALIVPKPSKCQWCLQGKPAVCVCLCRVRLRGFMPLCVYVFMAERFPSRPRVRPCCDPASVPQQEASRWCCWQKRMVCVCACVCLLVCFLGQNWDWTSSPGFSSPTHL